jgi:hypothetical protein
VLELHAIRHAIRCEDGGEMSWSAEDQLGEGLAAVNLCALQMPSYGRCCAQKRAGSEAERDPRARNKVEKPTEARVGTSFSFARSSVAYDLTRSWRYPPKSSSHGPSAPTNSLTAAHPAHPHPSLILLGAIALAWIQPSLAVCGTGLRSACEAIHCFFHPDPAAVLFGWVTEVWSGSVDVSEP